MSNPEVDKLHNIEAINDAINKTFKEVLVNESYLTELTAEYLAPVKADIKEQWGNLKAATDMDLAELKLLFKLYKRQQDAKHFDEEEDRNRVADNLRTAFAAMAAGGMLDFLDVLETGHEPKMITAQKEIEAQEAQAKADEDRAAGVETPEPDDLPDTVMPGEPEPQMDDSLKAS